MALPLLSRSRPRVDNWRSHLLLDDSQHRPIGSALVGLAIVGLALLERQGAIPTALAEHGMYIPIVVSAYFFGLRGAVVAAVSAVVALSWLNPRAQDLESILIVPFLYMLLATVAGRMLGEVDARRRRVIHAQVATLKSFATAVETDDERAGEHCERVAANARTLGEALGLDRSQLEELYWSGLLHDIGKVTVPREILRKPGGLTLEEYLVMRRHARLGANLLSSVESFRRVAEGVGAHHERWDGGGYPGGLREEAIPLFGRILAVVDVFEALSSDRPYRKALYHEDALAELRQSAGTQFDPKLVDLYEKLYREGRIQVADQTPVVAGQPGVEAHVAQHSARSAS